MELSCDRYQERRVRVLDPTVREFQPRRDAAVGAAQRIKDIAEEAEQLVWTKALLCIWYLRNQIGVDCGERKLY